MAEDKRVKHTKERISKAMIVCLDSTSLDKITVKQICETADVNRSTFYAHYPNPVALYRTLEQSMTESMNRHFEGLKNKTISYMDLLRHYLDYYYKNGDMFLALYKTDSKSMKKSFLDLVSSYDFFNDTVPDGLKTYIIDYHINGAFSIIARWLREDREKSVDDMAQLIYRLTRRPRQSIR